MRPHRPRNRIEDRLRPLLPQSQASLLSGTALGVAPSADYASSHIDVGKRVGRCCRATRLTTRSIERGRYRLLRFERAEEPVGGVAVEAVAVAVITPGRSRVGMPCGVLDIAQRRAFVEGERDECVAQLVRVEVGEADLLAEARDELAGVLARQPRAGTGDQQGAIRAACGGAVDGVADGRVERDRGGFRCLAFALDVQDPVAALLAEVLDVRADGFGDPQPELEQQQHEQSFAWRLLRARR